MKPSTTTSPGRNGAPIFRNVSGARCARTTATDGNAWDYFTHDQARSRAYRWGEDGLAGICDDQQRLCFALALWNGRDPILKERLFGLTNSEGNHGEDVKEYYFYLDSHADPLVHEVPLQVPAARSSPTRDLVETNRGAVARGARVRAARHRASSTTTATSTSSSSTPRTAPEDVLIRITRRTTAGPRRRRCTCCRRSGSATPGRWGEGERDAVAARGGAGRRTSAPRTPSSGEYWLHCDGAPELLFTENETQRAAPVRGSPNAAPYVKDALPRATSSHGQHGRGESRRATGTKAAAHYVLDVAAGGGADASACGCVAAPRRATPFGAGFDDGLRARGSREADEFYDAITPHGADRGRAPGHAPGAAPACSGRKQFYHYDVDALARGATRRTRCRRASARAGRNAEWFHMLQRATSSRCRTSGSTPGTPPGTWPSTRSPLALVDLDFAKEQLAADAARAATCTPTARSRPTSGTSATSTRRCTPGPRSALYKIEKHAAAGRTCAFLERVVPEAAAQLHLVGEPQGPATGSNVFAGRLPRPGQHRRLRPQRAAAHRRLRWSRPTARPGWRSTARTCCEIALELARARPALRGDRLQVLRALHVDRRRHGPHRRAPRRDVGRGGRLLLRRAAPARRPGHAPEGALDGRAAAAVRGRRCSRRTSLDAAARSFTELIALFRERHPELARHIAPDRRRLRRRTRPAAAVDPQRDEAASASSRCMLDENEFLGPLRHPLALAVSPGPPVRVPRAAARSTGSQYLPAESEHRHVRRQLQLARPGLDAGQLPDRPGAAEPLRASTATTSRSSARPAPGSSMTLFEVAQELVAPAGAASSCATPTAGGRSTAATAKFQDDPHWRDLILFYEYFHGDNGAGLGASHQTGWTGARRQAVPGVGAPHARSGAAGRHPAEHERLPAGRGGRHGGGREMKRLDGADLRPACGARNIRL
ncbi:MAG: hypothetical protein MZW92_76475 [Comamonadaceae bacterium]|nr:hypothetical protein [Comamonadaceae bacterium]